DHRRAALLVAQGEAQHNAGDRAYRPTLLEAVDLALELGDGAVAARAALVDQRTQTFMGVPDRERVAVLERVLEGLGAGDSSARARVLVALATELHFGQDPRRHELAREAVAVARRIGDPASLAHVLGLAGFALWDPDTLPERVAMAAELSTLARRLGDPVIQVHANLTVYYTAALQGDLARARTALAEADRLATELGQPALRLRTAYAQNGFAELEGRFDDAERFAVEGFGHARALDNPDGPGVYEMQLGVVRLMQGRPADAIGHSELAIERLPAHVTIRAFVAWGYAEADRHAEAREIIEGLGGVALTHIALGTYLTIGTFAVLSRAAVALGDVELSRRLYDELLPRAEEMALGQTTAFGPVAHTLGRLAVVLGDDGAAAGHFARAAELEERTGARGVLAETRLEWARLLLRRGGAGDREQAGKLIAAAAALAAELDLPAFAAQAAELSRAWDDTPARPDPAVNPGAP
ncbi:MAG TPA: hypothetical protein VHL53_19420, partial [Acidimicrobiia bacterium]|nr:hypothetical protein [Acidimicrobiia bacterium]